MKPNNISIALHWDKERRNEEYKYVLENRIGFEILSFSHYSIWENDINALVYEYKNEIIQFQDHYISFHGPIDDIIPHSENSEIARIAYERIDKSIDIACELGSKRIVFHTGINTIISDPNYKKLVVDKQSEFWQVMCSRHKDIEIVLENMWEKDFHYFYEIITNVETPNLGFCIDTGHMNVYSKDSMDLWINNLGKYLKHVHLNDNNGIWDEHLSIGKGNFDFSAFRKQISKIEGLRFVFELTELEEIKESIKIWDLCASPSGRPAHR